jgi:hypothetical protein
LVLGDLSLPREKEVRESEPLFSEREFSAPGASDLLGVRRSELEFLEDEPGLDEGRPAEEREEDLEEPLEGFLEDPLPRFRSDIITPDST